MDHRFRSQRTALAAAREGLSLAGDVLALAAMSAEDRARTIERRDPDVANPEARSALARRSGRLGLLLTDLDAACKQAGTADEPAFEIFARPWAAFLRLGGAADAAALDGLRALLEQVARGLRARRDALALVEEDAGDASSSYSDYSDSETESDSGRSDGGSDSETAGSDAGGGDAGGGDAGGSDAGGSDAGSEPTGAEGKAGPSPAKRPARRRRRA